MPHDPTRVIDPDFARDRPRVVLGMMSGTSLDGLDLCAVRLRCGPDGSAWSHEILATALVPYDDPWRATLDEAFAKTRDELGDAHRAYGRWLGERAADFARERALDVDLVASHGHTVHHRPEAGYTFQLGDGAALARAAGLPVVADFRSRDVAIGGQGAPLVPVADRLLYGGYAQCLNLGGIANVSYEAPDARRRAFDVTVCNQLLNRLATRLGHAYDEGGTLAAAGPPPDAGVLRDFANLAFHAAPAPRSLGREWAEAAAWPVFAALAERDPRRALRTATEAVARVLAEALALGPAGEVLATGGGAHNRTLVAGIARGLPASHALVLPEGQTVDFKEAAAFALLGALRVRGEANCLASVTGARADSSGGDYFAPGANP